MSTSELINLYVYGIIALPLLMGVGFIAYYLYKTPRVKKSKPANRRPKILVGTENTWYVNGTQLAPLVYQNNNKVGLYGTTTTVPAVAADATSINGSTSIDFRGSAGSGVFGGAVYNGQGCVFGDQTTGDFSILYRANYPTTLEGQLGNFMGGRFQNTAFTAFDAYVANSTTMSVRMSDETGNQILNGSFTMSTLSTATWYDFLFIWDNSAQVLEMFLDGVSQGTISGSRFFGIGGLAFDTNWTTTITLGTGLYTSSSRFLLDEAIIWNYVLTSGEISAFTGSSRSSYFSFTPTPESSGGGRIVKVI